MRQQQSLGKRQAACFEGATTTNGSAFGLTWAQLEGHRSDVYKT